MRNRIIVHLLPEEKAALLHMSEQDTRPPDAQLRYLLLSEAAKRGILSETNRSTVIRQESGASAEINL